MPAHLILRLEAPLLAFGDVMIDSYGVVGDFPAASMLTGLLANALGWRRGDVDQLDRLQARLLFAARLDAPGVRVRDFQTAQIGAADKGWTTRGRPEGRAGGGGTYRSPHLRYRDYDADAVCVVALRLEPKDGDPTLERLAEVLLEPARPLFIGRKPCLPSAPILAGAIPAETALDAVLQAPYPIWRDFEAARRLPPNKLPVLWPEGEGETNRARAIMLCDQRNWRSGVHGGVRRVFRDELQLAERVP